MSDTTPASPASGAERREAPRVELHPGELVVRLRTLADFLEYYAQNISSGGMYIRCEDLLPIDTEFHFEFTMSEEQASFEGVGRVTWVQQDPDDGERGMGVRFVHLAAEAKQLLRQIIAAKRKELGV